MKISVSKTGKTKPFHKHWQFAVGSDHAKQALRADYLRQLKYVHDELGIQHVRFHGIFSDDMHTLNDMQEVLPIPGLKVSVERSFYYCGVVYDNILSTGMKPVVELSFMPSPIASGEVTGKMFYGSNVTIPKDFALWGEHITEFVRYLLNRYGKEEVESWPFEVWNEPDITQVFFKGTQQDYFKLYETTVKAIKAVDPNIKVGGPSASGSRWIGDFMAFCKEKNLPVDFISSHQYAGEPLTGIRSEDQVIDEEKLNPFTHIDQLFAGITSETSQLEVMRMVFGEPSENEHMPENVFRDNSKIVKEQAEGLPVYYTEWNFSATFSEYGNDSIKAAAYLVKTALDIENNVTGSSVWCFSDIFEEMRQFTEEFHGGFGLMTINGIPKPTFYALKLLGNLADNRVELDQDAADGEIGRAVFEDEEKLQILIFRQKMQQKKLPAEPAELAVELENAPKTVILERIDQTHCNPLKIWEDMGCPRDLTPAQAQNIKQMSSLKKEEPEYSFQDGVLNLRAELGVNDIYLYTIVKRG